MTDRRRVGNLLRRVNNTIERRHREPQFRSVATGGVSMYMGLVAGAFTTTDSTFSVDNLTKLAGPVSISGSSQTVQNTFAWDGDDNAVVIIVYNQTDSQWEALQVACPA